MIEALIQSIYYLNKLLLQITPGSKQPEVTSQVLMDVTLRLCSGEVPEGLIDSNNCSSNSPELSASPTGKKWGMVYSLSTFFDSLYILYGLS